MTKSLGRGRGRPRGARNKRTVASLLSAEAAAVRMEKIIPEAFIGGGHEYLMSVYKDPSLPTAVRVDAAARALPYEKPKLSPIEASSVYSGAEISRTVIHKLDAKSAEIVRKMIA